MENKFEFSSQEEQRKIEAIKEEMGIAFYEKEGQKFVNILGVELETYATEEDIKEIKERWVLSEFDIEVIRIIAECYKLRQPLMLEGGPGAGKTFLAEKFIKIIHGKDAPILSLTGTSKLTDLDILGHWTPKGSDGEDETAYREKLGELMKKGEGRDVNDEFNQKLLELNERFSSGFINEDDFQNEYSQLLGEYKDKSYEIISTMAHNEGFIKSGSDWQFKEGPLLQAYSGREGKGNILFVDEFNLIPSNHQQIFLRIGGKEGSISDSFDFHGNSGKNRYSRGKDTWICFAQNYPEKTGGRSVVVDAMADRLVWKSISPEASLQKKKDIILTGGGRMDSVSKEIASVTMDKLKISIPTKEQLVWYDTPDRELGRQITQIINSLDEIFVNKYHQVGDRIIGEGNEEIDRIQKFEFSARAPLRFFSYIDNFQVKDPETGKIDFAKTIQDGFKRYYLGCLVSLNLQKEIEEAMKEIIYGDIGKVEFEGEIKTRKEVLDILVERSCGSNQKENVGEKTKDTLTGFRSFEDSLSRKMNNLSDKIRKI